MNELPNILAALAWISILYLYFDKLRARRKRRRSLTWPIIDGVFQSGTVERGESSYELNITFSYLVAEAKYVGQYLKDFSTEEEASAVLHGLQQGAIPIRYDPVVPRDYVIVAYRDGGRSKKS